ncbi:MAG: ribonuclease HII [Candidatus Saccharimonadales bacterium]
MIIVGIDEVGRGSLAGPLVAGAVVLDRPIRGLKDSKLLTRNQREKLDKTIRVKALALGLGWVGPSELDEIGLTAACRLAMSRALKQIICSYDEIIIDGNYNFLSSEPRVRTLIKADQLIPAVSAASIIAKVARDNFMIELASQYENYGFEKHAGYCTKAHLLALNEFGPCAIHRKSFMPVKLLQEQLL